MMYSHFTISDLVPLQAQKSVEDENLSDLVLLQAQKLVENENIMLQTLGFDIAIEHPHTFVVKCCQLVRGMYSTHDDSKVRSNGQQNDPAASKDLAQTSYFMATNSLHLTTMCLQYNPTVVACVCIHLACKWSRWTVSSSRWNKISSLVLIITNRYSHL